MVFHGGHVPFVGILHMCTHLLVVGFQWTYVNGYTCMYNIHVHVRAFLRHISVVHILYIYIHVFVSRYMAGMCVLFIPKQHDLIFNPFAFKVIL